MIRATTSTMLVGRRCIAPYRSASPFIVLRALCCPIFRVFGTLVVPTRLPPPSPLRGFWQHVHLVHLLVDYLDLLLGRGLAVDRAPQVFQRLLPL